MVNLVTLVVGRSDNGGWGIVLLVRYAENSAIVHNDIIQDFVVVARLYKLCAERSKRMIIQSLHVFVQAKGFPTFRKLIGAHVKRRGQSST
jgi:hypothetical protein